MRAGAFSRRAVLAGAGALGAGLALPAPALAAGRQAATAAGRQAAPAAGRAARPAPLVLGHRGACAHRPEHTLASYARAIADGADFIEPDLVATRDGVLVIRHENNLTETTDVATRPAFADRRTTKTIDGQAVTGWFSEDFTLAEIKSLRARERLGALRPESQGFAGVFQVLTFEEMVDFIAAEAATLGRPIGIIPEIKHSSYFAGIGLPLEPRFLKVLAEHSYLASAPVIVQSFEVANLQALHAQLAGMKNLRLMQLTESDVAPYDRVLAGDKRLWAERTSPQGLAEMARYADFVAPYFRDIIPQGADGRLGAPTGLVEAAHAAGLLVGTWTFRPENHFIAADFRDGAGEGARNPAGSVAEIRRYLAAGIDAFFTDDPALGRAALAR